MRQNRNNAKRSAGMFRGRHLLLAAGFAVMAGLSPLPSPAADVPAIPAAAANAPVIPAAAPSSPVSVEQGASGNATPNAAPAIQSADPAVPGGQAAGTINAGQPIIASVPANKVNANDGALVKTLFFLPEEMAAINHALDIYTKRAEGQGNSDTNQQEDFLKQFVGTQVAVAGKNYTYPQFYLESLVYHSPDDWSVRINEERITPQKPAPFLRVVAIDKDKVSIEWKPVSMAKVNAAGIPTDRSVTVDSGKGVVGFTLRSNQTFSSYAMRVLEGKVRPAVVETSAAENASASSHAPLGRNTPARENITPPDPVKEENTQGLGGLLNRYKNMQQEPKP